MPITNSFTKLLDIEFPMIMAPMFLVSNEEMMKAAMDNGIAGCFPTLNFREEGELEGLIDRLNQYSSQTKKGTYGVNIIVQKSNPMRDKHLKICVDRKVPFYITSLGSPKQVIEAAHEYGAKVFCDVTNMTHAKKCYDLGCDGFIAVGQGAGGHAGPNPLMLLIPALKKAFPDKMVIGAGGIATGQAVAAVLTMGGDAVSVGTRFIASEEAGVNDAYKNAIVSSKMDDIVMTNKISGTPCTIINTPYAKKIGYNQNWLERMLSTNNTTKKWFKMLVQLRGMSKLKDSIQPASYKTLWVAGKSSEMVDSIESVKSIVESMVKETKSTIVNVYNAVKE